MVSEGFKIVALGGLGEIGMNCLVVESQDRLLVIDCGVLFSAERLGIDLIHPGFDYLVERRNDIEGVVLTHAHEDHLSGVPYLLRQVDVPIYGTPYSLGLLEAKLKDADPQPRLSTRCVRPRSPFSVGPFEVELFEMPHSIVENCGLVVAMSEGRLMHTGDFKLEGGQERGPKDVLAALKELSADGVDLLLCDATGAEEQEVSGKEEDVEAYLEGLIQGAEGRVFVGLFSSNIRRLKGVLDAAARAGRKVALSGRSVETHYRVASSLGLMPPSAVALHSLEDAADLPRKEALIVVAGTQGEARSALGRLASDNHRRLQVEPGDLVVLSSRFIPGNELAIAGVIDNLLRLGAKVAHRGNEPGVHVSGHGGAAEIRQVIDAVHPRCFMPVHGTYRHLVTAADIARSAGVAHVAIAVNGQVVRCDKAGIEERHGFVATSKIHIDSGGALAESAIQGRRLLAANGVLSVSLCLDGECRCLGLPEIQSRGVVQDEAFSWLIAALQDEIKRFLSSVSLEAREDTAALRDALRANLRRFLSKQIGREPYIIATVHRL
ncbi:MAG: ribonuclease J [Myxococcota bacterium]|jgi:ribonuclease J|nr:ribonuclease J [Myxococcota bacterium]